MGNKTNSSQESQIYLLWLILKSSQARSKPLQESVLKSTHIPSSHLHQATKTQNVSDLTRCPT